MTPGIVPKVSSTFGEKAGLFTFHRDWKPGNACPDELKMWKHPQLNEGGENPGEYAGDRSRYSEYHNNAKSLAVKQTAHEWSRLLMLVEISRILFSVVRTHAVLIEGFPNTSGTPYTQNFKVV